MYLRWSGSDSSIQIALMPYFPRPSYQCRTVAFMAAGLVASTSAFPVGVTARQKLSGAPDVAFRTRKSFDENSSQFAEVAVPLGYGMPTKGHTVTMSSMSMARSSSTIPCGSGQHSSLSDQSPIAFQ